MHFSLDFWNTLATANAEYAFVRSRLLAARLGVPVEQAAALYAKTKRLLDLDAADRGIGYSVTEVYERLAGVCGIYIEPEWLRSKVWQRLDGFRGDVEAAFWECPPVVSVETISVLDETTRRGHTFSISSNTNFVSGYAIDEYLQRIGINPLFSVYSDIEQVAKPNPRFFETVQRRYLEVKGNYLLADNAVHIGDSPVCDHPPESIMRKCIIEGPAVLADAVRGYCAMCDKNGLSETICAA